MGEWETTKREQVYADTADRQVTQSQVIGIINDQMGDGDVIVCAAGTVPSDISKLFDAAGGRQLHLEFGNSCMGYDIPAAIGVRLSETAGEVYVLLGDGNYQLHPMELVTAIQERAKLIVVLTVNYGYQSIHGHQKGVRRSLARQRVQGPRQADRADRRRRIARDRLREERREHRPHGRRMPNSRIR